ncbi:caveolin-1-like [Anneissia japonica]|uniref:caveolin-1-like n=1 Tax=Anneissia japonica TaxID=1529436 RepID=UPI0014256A7E|nr:caveolin-1-like [Anneissia japonica]
MATEIPSDIDMVQRDPSDLNSHVKVMFEEVLGEPDGSHSIDGVWRCAFKCFEGSRNLCYRILTAICAVPLAFCWGCEFAFLSFYHVWCVTPYLKAYIININSCKIMYRACCSACCDPCFESVGRCLSDIRVTYVNQ